jgi:hypothetical protein
MPHIAKVVCNQLGWTVPSGLDAKSDNAEYGPFEAHYHFGFEEWLFNKEHIITIEEGEFHFGFLECFNSNQNIPFPDLYDELFLFTQLYSNNNNPNQLNTKRIVAKVHFHRAVNHEIYQTILLQHPGIVTRMRNELETILINSPVLIDALHQFDLAAEDNKLFNFLFFAPHRFAIPNQGLNWEYLQMPFGNQQLLPNNFRLNHLGIVIINDLLNNQHIPQLINQ